MRTVHLPRRKVRYMYKKASVQNLSTPVTLTYLSNKAFTFRNAHANQTLKCLFVKDAANPLTESSILVKST